MPYNLYDPSQSTGLGGLLGNAVNSPLFTLGAGLLARSGPSLTPVSGLANIGLAAGDVSTAQQQALENEVRRSAILESAQERAGLQRVQDLFANSPQLLQDQPLLGGLLATGYKPAIQGVATALADPSYGINLAANRAKVAGDASTNVNNYQNAYTGEKALEVLKAHPGSETLIKNPMFLQLAQALKSGADVLPQLKALLPKNLSDTDAAAVLDAAATVAASRDVLAAQGGIAGDTSNVGLDFYSRAFKQARERAEAIASAGGKPFELPSPPMVAFGETQPTPATPPPETAAAPPPPASSEVPQLPPGANPVPVEPSPNLTPGPAPGIASAFGDAYKSIYTKLFGPSAATAAAPAPAPAPAATPPIKVPSLRYSPTTGLVMFRSKAEFDRANANGSLAKAMPHGGQVEIGGVTYPVTVGGPSGG